MSLYGDALSAVKSIILIDARTQGLAAKVELVALELRDLSTRLTRLETIIEVTRPDGATLRIAPKPRPRRAKPAPRT